MTPTAEIPFAENCQLCHIDCLESISPTACPVRRMYPSHLRSLFWSLELLFFGLSSFTDTEAIPAILFGSLPRCLVGSLDESSLLGLLEKPIPWPATQNVSRTPAKEVAPFPFFPPLHLHLHHPSPTATSSATQSVSLFNLQSIAAHLSPPGTLPTVLLF